MANGQLEDWEIELIGDVKNFCPIIKEVADELHIPDYAIKAELVNPDEANFAYFNIFSVERRNPSPTLIGVLTLKSIGTTRIILRIPPRSQWSQRIHGADKLIKMGVVNEDEETRAFYDAQFAKYIERLQAKLKHYGLKFTLYKRLWRWFKEIIGIAKAVKL